MKITDRYASAINSRTLTVDPKTTMSDTDVLGAYGLAAKRAPLAVALSRLLAGDNRAQALIVDHLADDAWRHARHLRVKCSPVEAADLARACLAWYRHGACRPCGGHGKLKIPGTVTLGVEDCPACRGFGRMPLEAQVIKRHRELASWLVAIMKRELATAGPAAMAALAPKMDL